MFPREANLNCAASRRDIVKTARRFNAGNQTALQQVPEGHSDNSPQFQLRVVVGSWSESRRDDWTWSRSSLQDLTFFQSVPALKCRAIFAGSCGTRRIEMHRRKAATVFELDSDFSPTYIAFVKQDRLNLEKDRLNNQPSTNC